MVSLGTKFILKKYKFGVKYIKYFRFIITIKGIEVNTKKVKAIYNWKPPYTIKGI